MGSEKKMLTGNYAAAYGAKLARVEAVPVYPITPQTTVMEKLIEFITRKEMEAEYIPVESEHSAMAAAIGAEATGVRTFTASSSQGIAYMHENLFVASGLRLPIVMVAVNRCISPPISIFPDHSDSLAQRDTGWLQIYVENAQEILDMIIQAYKIAVDKNVLLPAAICYEGLVVSHFLEPVEVPEQGLVDEFLPPCELDHVVLDPKRPMHLSVMVNEKYFMEYRYQQEEAMERSKEVIQEVDNILKRLASGKQKRKASKALKEALYRVHRALALNPDLSPFGAIPLAGEGEGMGGAGIVAKKPELPGGGKESGSDQEGKVDEEANRLRKRRKTTKKSPKVKRLTPNAIVQRMKFGETGVSVCVDDFGEDGPECFTEGTVIYVNQQHPLYRREAKKQETYILNVTRLITQEISLMKDTRSPRQAFSRQSKLLRDAFIDDSEK